MLNRSTDIGFPRGLHTDSLGVEGALLEAQDVIVMRDGELRKRGGKRQITAPSTGSLTAMGPALSVYGLGTLANFDTSLTARTTSTFAALQRNSTTTAFGSSTIGFDTPTFNHLFAHNGEIMSPSKSGAAGLRWKGSRKSRYSTGTVATTSGSKTITGTGTTWTGNVEAGMYLYIEFSTLAYRTFLITSVDSNTTLTVDQAPDVTASGKSYNIAPVGAIGGNLSVTANPDSFPTGQVACSHQGRVFMGNMATLTSVPARPERIRWSATPTETSGMFIGADYWNENAYTDIGVGTGGAITSLQSTGSSLLVFKENAVYALRGTVATNGSDLGARVDLVSANHGLLSAKGAAQSRMGVVFADYRGAFVCNGDSIDSLTRGRIQRAWEADMQGVILVSAVRDRIIFSNQTSACVYVYDIATDTWTKQGTSIVYGPVVEVYNSTTGRLEYEMGFRAASNMTDDWADDFTTNSATDAGASSYPDIQVVTHPIALSDPVGNARPVRVDVNGYASGAALDVSIIPGRQGGTEFAVGTLPTGSTDKSHRLRVPPGASLNAYYQVKLATSATMSDARIYGVSILSAPSGRVDV